MFDSRVSTLRAKDVVAQIRIAGHPLSASQVVVAEELAQIMENRSPSDKPCVILIEGLEGCGTKSLVRGLEDRNLIGENTGWRNGVIRNTPYPIGALRKLREHCPEVRGMVFSCDILGASPYDPEIDVVRIVNHGFTQEEIVERLSSNRHSFDNPRVIREIADSSFGSLEIANAIAAEVGREPYNTDVVKRGEYLLFRSVGALLRLPHQDIIDRLAQLHNIAPAKLAEVVWPTPLPLRENIKGVEVRRAPYLGSDGMNYVVLPSMIADLVQEMLADLNPSEGVIDLGCGGSPDSTVMKQVAERFPQLAFHGVDRALRLTGEGSLGGNIIWRRQDALEFLRSEPPTARVMVLSQMLSYCSRDYASNLAHECYRALPLGGVVFVCNYIAGGVGTGDVAPDGSNPGVYEYGEGAVPDIFVPAGFAVRRTVDLEYVVDGTCEEYNNLLKLTSLVPCQPEHQCRMARCWVFEKKE